MKTYRGYLNKTNMPTNGIFVFGSNTQGRHHSGNAVAAISEFGAIYGQAKGLQGKSYAIITTDLTTIRRPSIKPIRIVKQINDLYKFAEERPDLDFYIGYSGNSINLLSGFSIEDIAEFFSKENIPNNIIFEEEFKKLLK